MIEYLHGGGISQTVSIDAAFQTAVQGVTGPDPSCGQTSSSVPVYQGQEAVFQLNGSSSKCIAFPLLTCASVILQSQTAPNTVAVFHAPSGTVTNADVIRLHGLIGNPPAGSLRAIYAISKPWDNYYAADAGVIEAYIGQPNSVCYLQQIGIPVFGINANGYIGY